MKFERISDENRNYINGRLAYLIDDFIRKNKVWSEQQIYEKVIQEISELVKKGLHKIYYNTNWTSKEADNWLLSTEGKMLIHERIAPKYKTQKKIADRISPILERVRFGFKNVENKDFEISYGRKNGISRMSKDELLKLNFTPWSIKHFENQLFSKYKIKLPVLLDTLCESFLEKRFKDYWLKNFYGKETNPALIPEFAGLGYRFYYKKDEEGNIYRNEDDTLKIPSRVRSSNFRFDFLLINSFKSKAVILELDSFAFHKEKNDQIRDSIKRNAAAEIGIPIVVFTSDRIKNDIKGCFDEIKDYLSV